MHLFDIEESDKPRCYGRCAETWPPVQVTYDGHPLYFYAHEDKHEVGCHDIFLNDGTWYAVQPDGHPAP